MTQTCYTGDGSSGGLNGGAFNSSKFIGNRFSTGNVLIGQDITQFTVLLTTVDDGVSSELSAQILNSGGSVIATSTNTINNNTLNEYSSPTWGQFTECVFTFASHTLADGEKLVIRNSTPSTSLRAAQLYEFSPAPNPVYCSSDDCPLNTHQIRMCVTTGSVSSGGTRLPPPPIILGGI